MNIFITAIGTDSGKTIVSSIFAEAFQADYWKPIQAGTPKDTDTVKSLVSNNISTFHLESYVLKSPESPHAAARKEGILIKLDNIKLPTSKNNLIIEGAGGILVPLNDTEYVIDIAQKFQINIVLVSNIYLGSINHTLLSINELKRRQLNVLGIVFNGDANTDTEELIIKKSGYKQLLKINKEERITQEVIKKYAQELKLNLIL